MTIPIINYRELALRYEGMFRVCYRHNAGIVSISDIHGNATKTGGPWQWNGNDPGYPYGVKYSRRAEFFYKGSMQICIVRFGCGPVKHPWEKITFRDDNTITRSGGVT